MATTRRTYPPAFKAKAVALASKIGSGAAAEQLNTRYKNVHTWRKEAARAQAKQGASGPKPATMGRDYLLGALLQFMSDESLIAELARRIKGAR